MLRERYKGNIREKFSKNFYYNWINHIGGTRSLYVVVSKKVLLSEKDLNGMLQYVDNGNQLFIAAAQSEGCSFLPRKKALHT